MLITSFRGRFHKKRLFYTQGTSGCSKVSDGKDGITLTTKFNTELWTDDSDEFDVPSDVNQDA